MSWRVSAEVKQRIDELCAISGRTQASTIERLIERGVDADRELGGPRAASFWRSLAQEVEALVGDDRWLTDASWFDLARKHLVRRLHAIRIVSPPDGLAHLIDAALDMAIDSDPKFFQTARSLAADLPDERRAEALAAISEIEREPGAHRARRISVRLEAK